MSLELQAPPAEELLGQTSPHAWPRFVRWFLVLLGLQLGALAILNYLVNPRGIHPISLLPPVAANVRAEKAYLLKQMQPKPQALILGSSRVMKIAPSTVERLTGLGAFNAGNLSAYTEDHYVMLRYAVERAGVQPRLVLLGLELEALHDQEPMNEFLLEPNSISAFLLKGENRHGRWNRLRKLLSWNETRLSLRSLRHWAAASTPAEPQLRIDPDGRLVYVHLESALAAGTLRLETLVQQSARMAIRRYQNYRSPSADRLDYLDATLRYAGERNIRVVVFLTPVHRAVRAELKPYAAKDAEFAAAVQQAAARWNAEFHDLRDVEAFHGRPDGFYDGTHVDDDNADRIAVRLLAPAPQAARRTHALQ